MGTDEQKRAFALAYKQIGDPNRAAQKIFPRLGDGGNAYHASITWLNDPIVIAELDRLTEEHAEIEFMPSKAVTARTIYAIAENTSCDPDTRLRAFKLYCEVMQYTGTPSVQINNNDNRVVNAVMMVPAPDADWENRMIAQQQKLIADARSTG